MMRYQRPDPRTGTTSGNGGKGGNGGTSGGFMPGEISGLAEDMVLSDGGNVDKWKDFLRDVYSPNIAARYNFRGGGGKGNGGGKNDPNGPNKPGTGPDGVTGEFDPSRPDHKMAQMQAMQGQMPLQRGFLPVTQPLNQAPTTGLFAAQQQMQQGRQPGQGQQPQLPPEILAMMRARQMGR